MIRKVADGIGAAVTSGVVTVATRVATGWAQPGGKERWVRLNHQQRPVSLLEGPAVVAGLLTGTQIGSPWRIRGAATVAIAGAAVAGYLDDHSLSPRESADAVVIDAEPEPKGFKGHIAALRRGHVTTGAIKIGAITGASAVAAAVLPWKGKGAASALSGKAVDIALIAGSANLLNLLDLRPGRALKVAGAASVPLLVTKSGSLAATVLGTSIAALPDDLDGKDMLGDTGSNAVGAAVGVAMAAGLPRPVKALAAAGIIALTIASEKVSFSQVIENNPLLKELDDWGRQGYSESHTS